MLTTEITLGAQLFTRTTNLNYWEPCGILEYSPTLPVFTVLLMSFLIMILIWQNKTPCIHFFHPNVCTCYFSWWDNTDDNTCFTLLGSKKGQNTIFQFHPQSHTVKRPPSSCGHWMTRRMLGRGILKGGEVAEPWLQFPWRHLNLPPKAYWFLNGYGETQQL